MADDDRPAGGSGRLPFGGADDDDLFVWDGLRRPSRSPEPAASPRSGELRGPPDDAPPWDEGAAPRSRGGSRAASGERRMPSRPAAPARGADDEWQGWLDPGEGAQAGEPAVGDGPGGPFGPDALGHVPERRRPRRRRLSAGAVLAAMLIGFFFAGLLDVKAIETEVKGKPLGTARSVELALLKPMVVLSGALRFDRPAAALDAMLGRGETAHHSIAEVKDEVKPKWPRKITRADKLRLYIIGDSMAQVFGSSLENLAEETHLIKAKLDYKVSSGLSRPDFFDWPQHMIDQIVEYDPDATAVLFGANDGQNVLYKGKVLEVGSKAWQEVYAKRVGKAMDILTKGGRRAYWVGNPIMRDPGYRDRISMMDNIYKAEAKKHAGVFYIPTWALFADAKGSYTGDAPRRERRPCAHARPRRHPPDARRRRPHGAGRARRHREGLGHTAGAVRPPGGSVTRGGPSSASSTQSRVRNSQKARPAKAP